MKKFLSPILAISVVVLVVAGLAYLSSRQTPTDKVLVASNFPMSGILGLYGTSIKKGVDLAIADFPDLAENVEFRWGDNQGRTTETDSVLSQQLTMSPDIYMSGLKPQTLVISDRLTALDIPHFTWILDYYINPASTNNFRVWLSFKDETEVMTSYAATRDLSRVLVTFTKTPAAEEQYLKFVIPKLKELGAGKVLVEQLPLDFSDFETLTEKVKRFDPTFLIVNGFVPQMVGQITSFRGAGLIKENNTFASLDMLDAAPDIADTLKNGIIVASPRFLISGDQDWASWEAKYSNLHKSKPDHHAAFGYETARVILSAVDRHRETGKSITESLREVKTRGLLGEVSFDTDQSATVELLAAEYEDGQLRREN